MIFLKRGLGENSFFHEKEFSPSVFYYSFPAFALRFMTAL